MWYIYEKSLCYITPLLPVSVFERLWRKMPDNCEVCKGKRGGVKGNENRIDGKIVCDHCSIDYKTNLHSN